MIKDKGIGYFLDPGYKTKEDLANEQREKFYKDTIEPFMQGKKIIEPLGPPKDNSFDKFLEEGPPIQVDITKYKPVKKTRFTDKELENYMKDQSKWKEKIRKFRQDPQWVKEHNERFPSFKTTVLPKDKPYKYESFANSKVERITPVQKKRDQWNKKVEENKKKKPMNIVAYVDKMSNLYDGNPRQYDDNGKPLNKTWSGGALKMAEEEAEHLNNIKRQTWNKGGRVGPEPKYVSAQDVINVYDPKEPKATPGQLKGLHQRLKNHNERTGQMKQVEGVIDYYDPQDDHPYIQGKMEEIKAIEDKGKSWLVKHLRKQNRESENGQLQSNKNRRYI